MLKERVLKERVLHDCKETLARQSAALKAVQHF
jgi:hypothetical protein